MKVDLLHDVDDGRHQLLGQGEGRIVLRITADLKHALTQFRKRHGQIRRRGALADPALAVDGKYLGAFDRDVRILVYLQAARSVRAHFVYRNGAQRHAFTS